MLGWGTEGSDGDSRRGDSDGDSYSPSLLATSNRPRAEAIDATPTASPAALATPGLPDVSGLTAPTGAGEPSVETVGDAEGAGDVQAAFIGGYRDGGGDPAWEQGVLSMVQCESEWVLDPPGPHLGPAQFEPGTWETVASVTGLWDYTDPFHVGYNVAVWMAMIPGQWGTSAGWPNCWR